MVVLITPVSIGSIGWKTYVYFAIFNAVFIPAIYFFCKWRDMLASALCFC